MGWSAFYAIFPRVSAFFNLDQGVKSPTFSHFFYSFLLLIEIPTFQEFFCRFQADAGHQVPIFS